MTASLEKLKEEVTKILEDPFEKGALNYFNFLKWIEDKIEIRTKTKTAS